MDFNILMYLVFGVVAIAGGLVLLFAKHPIRSAMGLLATMLALAGMYAILQAHSIAIFQIIIYAGAIMILIIYFIMLLDIQSKDYLQPFSKLFWIGAGENDTTVTDWPRRLSATLTRHGIEHTFIETTGGHTWINWRLYLPDFAQLLFRDSADL